MKVDLAASRSLTRRIVAAEAEGRAEAAERLRAERRRIHVTVSSEAKRLASVLPGDG